LSSEDELSRSAKEFADSLKKLVKTSAKTAQHAVEDTFPGLSHFFENVVKDTEKGVSDLLKGLDKTTAKEQKEILSAYRKILATQIEKIDQRLKEIDKKQ
jgi:dipeptidase